MEVAGKDSEEDTLQLAFKKLRVDAENRLGSAAVSDSSRGTPRASLDGSGAKIKLTCPKDNWHGCSRKSSRGSSRSQRRRRSKSPILHPPKFTYCGGGGGSSSGSMKQQRLAAPAPADVRPPADGCGPAPTGQKESCPPAAPDHAAPPLVFGSCVETREEGDGAEGPRRDFRALSELQGGASNSDCSATEPPSWNGVEVYSFTGLRDVIAECEGGQREQGGPVPRTVGSQRSCSEQARGFVDDITIEDLSGYMEFYLYIPKKMSHMAEMMYT